MSNQGWAKASWRGVEFEVGPPIAGSDRLTKADLGQTPVSFTGRVTVPTVDIAAIRNEILLTIEREGRVQSGDIDAAIRKAMAVTGTTDAASLHEAQAKNLIDMLCRNRPQLGLTVIKAPDGTYQIKGQCAGHSFDKCGVPAIDLAWSIFKAADTLIETVGARRAGMPKGD